MYGKLNKLVEHIKELLQQLNKNWHRHQGNLHDMNQQMEQLFQEFQHFMQGNQDDGKLQNMIHEMQQFMNQVDNHLQSESDTVHHFHNKLQELMNNFHHLVHR
uniref:WA20 n=1 Tax=synthetic construct TaxID=32630 RepID=UPI000256004B